MRSEGQPCAQLSRVRCPRSQHLAAVAVAVAAASASSAAGPTRTDDDASSLFNGAAALRALDCDGSAAWSEWRSRFHKEGLTSTRVLKGALELWRSIRWSEAVPWHGKLPAIATRRSAENAGAMSSPVVWHEVLQGDPLMVEWLHYSVSIISAVLQSGSNAKAEKYLQEQRDMLGIHDPNGCLFGDFSPYAFLMVQYTLVYYFKVADDTEGIGLLRQFVNQIIACMEMILDIPFHSYDHLDVLWNVSSMDIAVNLINWESANHYSSFEEYARLNPVPAPYLPPWSFDIPRSVDLSVTGERHRRLLSEVLRRSAVPRSAVNIAVIHLHDATAWDDWSSLLTAWSSLLPYSSASASVQLELRPHFFFTRVAGLTGCAEDPSIRRHLRAPFEALKELQRSMVERAGENGTPPHLGLAEQFLVRWSNEGEPALRDAEIILCGEPVWLCPLLDRLIARPMLVRFNMAVLDEFPLGDEPSLNEWWSEFYGFVSRGRAMVSVGTRYTVEQVAYQTWGAVRFPYVPFLGLNAEPLRPQKLDDRATRNRDVLLFHSNLQPMLAFKMVLRMVEASLSESERSPNIVDMNDLPKGLCRPEMGAYEAAILLPHNPAPIRVVDLYAQGVLLYVPAEPLIHRWVWANRPFGGYRAPAAYTSMAPPQLRDRFGSGALSAMPPPAGHPPFSGTAHTSAWAVQRHVADRRYWMQYTEWELLPGLQRFRGIPELLAMLRAQSSSSADAAEVTATARAEMHRHLQGRRAEGLAWWRLALAFDGIIAER
eukprot:TRINITY_DN26845_c0_g1_i1.p1 TRINITY_DN26845_c0_g1~~TRINITY_DN26845_c0_g1_i1.p1  ORF type:complete len:769 (-),score=120.07 TRINITY_DN26845_c0_g1_i1:101-2407(-)